MLEFDHETHTYRHDGEIVPSVTQILEPLNEYAGIPKQILDQAKERGNYVHQMCEYHLWGTLDESTIDPEFLPYLEQFKRFLDETGFIAELIEQRVFNKTYRYAGTLDLAGIIPPKGARKRDINATIDIKTTFKFMKSVGPQTAAYHEALKSTKMGNWNSRYALRLTHSDYELLPLKDRADFNVFVSCLNIFNFMKRK